MEEFMTEISRVYPKLWVPFEVSSANCPGVIELMSSIAGFFYVARLLFPFSFRNHIRLFNDDIRGTGAVVLAGLLSALRLSPLQPHEHRILFYDAGSAGVGVATQLLGFFTLSGMSEEEIRTHIWLVDSEGLIYDGREHVAEHKKGTSFS